MSIAVTQANYATFRDEQGTPRRSGKLTITGLTAGGANTIPHGLSFTPRRLGLRPSALGLWGETADADATNIYITVGASGATSGIVDYWE